MKKIILFVLLFAALKVAGQTTGYLRYDTVKIMKQNGTCELYIINKTKDSLGVLTNIGGGLTSFKKSRKLTDSSFIVGNDTIVISGTGGISPIAGYGINLNVDTVKVDTTVIDARYKKRFNIVLYGADPDSNSTDDCPAIRAAVQAAYDAGGGIVYFPLGHFTANCPLIRSQDGVDPRAQIVIPLTQAGTGEYPRIVFEGELPGNFSGELVAGLNLPKNRYGVILESTILDTGYVIGSSFYPVTELAGDANYTWVEFKNIEIRTRTKTAGAEITGTMSGIDMNAPRSVNFDFVKMTTQSAETDVILPYTGTIGVRLPHVNNNAHITGTTLTVTGFYTGIIGGEHMNFQELITATCRDGLVLSPANHSGFIGQYTSEGCVNHIRVLDSSLFSGAIQPMDLHIANYNIEHYTTGGAWYAYSSDVLYDDTSVSTNVVIDYAHIAVSGVGESYVFNTNAPQKVVVGNTPIRSNYPYNRENGHYILNHASTASIDGNIFMNENNASGIGMSAASGNGVGLGTGGWLAIRADNYTANAGQRGIVSIGGGSPSTPTGGEGGISINTALTERFRILYNGNTQIGVPGTDDGGLLQVGKSTNGYNVYNFNNTNTGASARQALVLRGDNANRYLDFELHNGSAGNAATITGGSVLSEFNFISTGNYPIKFFTNSNGSSNERMRIAGGGNVLVGTTSDNGALFQVNGDATVADDAYDATGWNGNVEVPTKNAIRDKIESLSFNGITTINSQTGASQLISGNQGLSVSSSSDVHTISLNTTLESFLSDVNNSGTSETDLFSHTLSANRLTLNGHTARFVITGTVNDATATNQIQGYFAGNVIYNSGGEAISATGGWRIEMEVTRTSSTTARASVRFEMDNATINGPVQYTALTSLDFTATNIFKVTGIAGGAGGGSNDITATVGKVTFIP